jgi:anti-sigma B factor antagonist
MTKDVLQISTSRGVGGQTIFSLAGPLNIHAVFKFQEAVRSDPSPVLIIDCSGVPFIDSAGLGAMVGVVVSGRKTNRKIAFAAMTRQAKALIDMTGVKQFLHPYDTLQEAEAAVS